MQSHPDLGPLARRLRNRMDETLDAEQAAAWTAMRRRRTIRDRLLEAEDRVEAVVVTTPSGESLRGVVDGVGADHVVLVDGNAERWVALHHIATIEVRCEP